MPDGRREPALAPCAVSDLGLQWRALPVRSFDHCGGAGGLGTGLVGVARGCAATHVLARAWRTLRRRRGATTQVEDSPELATIGNVSDNG
jgi:hypothetical protein